MNDTKGKEKEQQDSTSTEASVNAGKKAIDAAKKTAPKEDEKKESEQKKDAEQWRNEG
ncbi:MAG TPA: hypothetical protein VHB70_15030 [Parafilimonas sp.]|nr:hypothetical protein [Parafilimonas sp.]